MLLALPVSDLQAANARAAAVGHGVGLGYWFSWFGGAVPGRYSLLSAWLSHLVGATVVASAATVVVVVLAAWMLRGTAYPRSSLLVVGALAEVSLWSGRVSFCLGAAFATAGALMLRERRPWTAGLLNVVAAFASPLAAAFAVLAASGLLGSRTRRADLLRYAGLSAVGLLTPTALFGAPGPTSLDRATFAKILVILLAPQLIALPRVVRLTLSFATATCVLCYFWPVGVGANISRFALVVMPPLVWASSPARRRVVALVLLPAFGYGAALLAVDLRAASARASQHAYYAGLEARLAAEPGLADHRLEVLDTPTHRPSGELAGYASIARGWDLQTDAGENPLFYGGAALDATSYRRWLDELAVAWVAVPDSLNAHNRAEAALIGAGLPYLTEVWSDRHWVLYAVGAPQPIASAPARVVSASAASIIVDVPSPMTVTLRLRPSPYLAARALTPTAGRARLTSAGPLQVRLSVDAPGRYRISATVTMANALSSVLDRLVR